jgi:cyclophilin family peptidyl-prolyl cis-trans isomerase
MSKLSHAVFLTCTLFSVASAQAGPLVIVKTNQGNFTLQLDDVKAPIAVANFLRYLQEGFYKGTLFHRSVRNFVVQGGGFTLGEQSQLTPKATHDPIVNEASNGLSNIRGTVAMARTSNPNSATSQFYVNVKDNLDLDYNARPSDPAGYAVFGKVIDGMANVDAINVLPVGATVFPTLTDFKETPLIIDGGKAYVVSITDAFVLQPVADAGSDQVVEPGAPVMLNGKGSPELSANVLSYQWTQIDGPSVNLNDAKVAQPQFTAPSPKTNTVLTFELVATYPNGETAKDTVLVTVKRQNHAPVADPGQNATVRSRATVTLDGSHSTDPDNDSVVSYQWQQVSGVPVALSNPAAPAPTFVAPDAAVGQTLAFALTVSDGEKTSPPQTVAITVAADNQPPTVELGADRPAKENSRVVLTGEARDPDGDGLGYLWEQVDNGAPRVELADVRSPSLAFQAPLVGKQAETLEFRLTVTDDFGPNPQSAADTVLVQVANDDGLLDCSGAVPSRASLWPANGGMVNVAVRGITGPGLGGNRLPDLRFTGVTQDEPVRNRALKDRTGPDAKVKRAKRTARKPLAQDTLYLRAERQSLRGNGNGRVYRVNFEAGDGGQTCRGSVRVQVPPTRTGTAVDDGQNFNAAGK